MQPLWRLLWKLSVAGMNIQNDDESVNGEYAFLSRTLSGGEELVVFDVGANQGDFCDDAIKINPNITIHAFEPNPPTYRRLEERFGARENIRLNNVGAADEDGSIEIFDYATGEGTEHASFLREAFEDLYHAEHTASRVPVIRIDDYVREHEIAVIDLLKIDVEGFELPVLSGATESIESGIIKAIVMEFNSHHVFADCSIWKISKMLDRYDIYRVLPGALHPLVTGNVPYNTCVEIFKYCNLVALRRSDA